MMEVEAVDEQPAIDAPTQRRYRVFKKNAPYLYDYVCTNALTWPSLTVQFFPDMETPHPELQPPNPESQLAYQRLLLGTFTLGQAIDTVSIYQLAHYRNLNKCVDMDLWHYNADKQEFEMLTVSRTRLRAIQTLTHRGDVNRLRYMPQNPDILASAHRGDLCVYNRTKHASRTLGDIHEPQLRLTDPGDLADIFAFDWNTQREGAVVCGSMAGSICVFDIRNSTDTKVAPQHTYAALYGVNDVEWVPTHTAVFVSAEDDGSLCVYDTRTPDMKVLGHTAASAANSVSVNHGNAFCIATGHADGTLSVYDVRSLDSPVVQSTPHTDSITQVKWHRTHHSVLGTCSGDRLVQLHDMHGQKVLFAHHGHMLGVNDFDWSHHDDWMVASVGDDNSVQIWRPAVRLLTT